jgi:hypothetical protein
LITGQPEIEKLVVGLRPVYLIVDRAGGGKTNLLCHIADEFGGTVACMFVAAKSILKSEWKLGVMNLLPLDILDETKLEPAVPPVYDKDKPRPIPGFALDKHTRAGKREGFGKANFYEEGAKLNNKTPIRDPCEARAIAGDLEVERRERMET